WTNESWPDDPSVLTDANAQKQLNDLKGILTVFDTSSFIERYSIYNWVEDARAMIIDGGGEANWQITPAGEYYRDNKSQIAYDIRNEVIPDWTINNSPVLNYKFLGEGSAIELDWYHEDWELINTFTLEIKEDDGPYNIIGIYENPVQSTFTEKVSVSASGNITFRVQSVGIDSSVQESNLIKFEVLGVENDFSIGHLSVPTNDWTLYLFDDNFSSVPIMIYGTPSFKNKTPLTQRVRNIGTNNFEFRLEQWDYLEMEPFTSPDSLAFLSLVPGNYNFGEISAEAGTVHGATRNWMQVDFTKTFDITPVVFVTLESDNGLPASARVRNVTSSGFELALQYEEGGNPGSSVENIAYLAITPGKGEINGERIIVSNTPASAVGEFFDSYRIEFGEEFDNPAFFGSMQTVNDNIASTLRYKTLTKTSVEVFKQREISETTNSVLPESVGWMVIDTEAIAPLYTNGDPVRDLRIYPNPTIDRLRFDGLNSPTQVSVYSMTGEEVLSSYVINYLDVRGLNKGVYLIKINDHKILRFIKE
ncbi:MAG: T9SS type A sorting domain-containing protein, partial [Cyclobacteriaceae bacterium]